MKILLAFFVFLSSFPSFSQTESFVFTLRLENDEVVEDIIEYGDGNYLCVGYHSPPFQQYENVKAFIFSIDKNGELIDSLTHSLPDKNNFLLHILPDTANNWILAGYSTKDSEPSDFKIELSFIDSNLAITNERRYALPDDCENLVIRVRKGLDREVLVIGGFRRDVAPIGSFNYRFSGSLDSIVAKVTYPQPGYGHDIRPLSDSTYWLLTWFYYNLLDDGMNLKEVHKLPILMPNYSSKWDSDSSFYLLGQFETSNHEESVGVIRQYHPFDTTGHLFLSLGRVNEYDYPVIQSGPDYVNKDSIFFGYTNRFANFTWGNHPSWFVVAQTDSMLNLRWERFYGGDAYYEMHKLIATSDGGCLLGGTKYVYQSGIKERDICIFKLNNEGIMVGRSESSTITSSQAIVYPNPGQHQINIRVAMQHSESVFRLFDMNGKMILSEKIVGKYGNINTSFLESGSYVYTITNSNGLSEQGKWIKN